LGRTISSAEEKVGTEVDFELLEEIKVNDVSLTRQVVIAGRSV
jgi:hypothetical protein